MLKQLGEIKKVLEFDNINAMFEDKLHLVNDILISYCFFFFFKGLRYSIQLLKTRLYLYLSPGFIYTFQEEDVESYENYLKHKKDFPFTVSGDLETTTEYISETASGSMFTTSYCLMFNFHPKLEITLITCLRSFGQNEQELKFKKL